MTKVIVLGAGMVGSVIALDLAEDFDVSIADVDGTALGRIREASLDVTAIKMDLSLPATVQRLVKDYDIVVGAMPSVFGLATLGAVIDAGKPYVDISFMEQDPRVYNSLAQSRGVTAIVDCGIAPGLSNILAGYAAERLANCEHIAIYVGGVPVEPKPPFFYKAAFAPSDVIQEYLRPARVVSDNEVVETAALSEVEPIFFEGLDKFNLEAFNTDGLRTLLSLDVPNMVEKTIRYAGHAEMMRRFRESGFFSDEPVIIQTGGGANWVKPIDMTQALLFPHWQYEPGERDMTLFKVEARGEREILRWEIVDYADPVTGFSSMARTTGFPATVVTRMLAAGELERFGRGVIPPEELGRDTKFYREICKRLREKGIDIRSFV